MISPRIVVLLALFPAGMAVRADEYDTLRAKWVASLTGSGYDTGDPDVASKLTSIANSANNNWSDMDKSPSRTFLWSDLASTSNSSQITTNYERLRTMAIAYATAGCSLEGDAALLTDLIGGLEWMDANRYNSTKSQYDNWWDWEIGTPMALTDITALIYSQLTSAQRTKYMDAVNHNTPTPDMTGANQVWKARVVGVRGCIVKSSSKLTLARDAFSDVFPYVTSGDGFYTDGSFIQHSIHPYTAGYGTSLLSNMAPVIAWLNDSTWEVTDSARSNLYQWIYDSYEPIIYRGAALDMVRGRELTRPSGSPQATGHSILRSILIVSQFAPSADEARMRSMVKYWALNDTVRDFVNNTPLTLLTAAKELMADAGTVPREELIGHYNFGSMDRVVHLRPGFGFGISMSSSRIARFESINGENMRGWFTGDGMTTLYNADLEQYGDAYWATINQYRLPGITVDTVSKTPPTDPDNANGQSSLTAYDWAGGATLGEYGVAGMRLDGWGVSLTARKSWFMFDDEIVCLGAGITSTDSRPIDTIVENRKLLDTGDNAFTVNGTAKSAALGWSQTMSATNWAHLAGNVTGADIGYYFPQSPSIRAVREARTGSWSDVDTDGSSTAIIRNYLRMHFEHGSNPTNATYQYVLLPGRSARRVSHYAAQPDITVLNNSTNVQAVKENTLGITAANFWDDSTRTGGIITVDKKACVLVQQDGAFVDVSVSDPTQNNTTTINVEIAAAATAIASADTGITVTDLSPNITFTVAVNGAKGRTFHARFFTGTPQTTNLSPVADAYVWDDNPTTNYGTGNTIVVKKSSSGLNRESFLRFNVPAWSGALLGASLKLTPTSASIPGVHGVAKVSNTTWNESGGSGITWNTKPSAGATITTWTPADGIDVNADVTSAIAGSGLISFKLSGITETSDGYVNYGARENNTAANRPLLVLVTGHTPPAVALTSPADGTLINRPGSLTLTADAQGTDGTITSVAFYRGAILLGTDTSVPYSVNTTIPAGTHQLTAVATDSNGLARTSLAARVDVAYPPTAAATNATINKDATYDLDLRTLVSDTDTATADLVFSLGSAVNGTVTLLPNGYTARFTPAAGYFGPAGFDYTVTDATDDPRLLLHYSFQPPDDVVDVHATDVSGKERDGYLRLTGTGAVDYTADVPAVLAPFQTQSLELTENSTAGAAKLERVVDSSEFNFKTANWTVSTWYKRTVNTNYDVLWHLGSGSGTAGTNELQLRHDNASNNFRLRNDNSTANDVNISTAPTVGAWHHVAAVRNGTTLSLYVDGTLIGSDNSFTLTFNASSPVVFGGHGSTSGSPDRWFNGSMADPAIFTAALTATEITRLATTTDVSHLTGQAATATVSLTVRSNLENWRLANFGTTANTGSAADTFDSESDGLENLLEFSVATNPKLPNAAPISAAKVGGNIEFIYTRNKSAISEVTYQVEWNDTLAEASWSAVGVTENILSDNGTVQSVKATMPAGAGGKRFVHLRVTRP